MSLSHQSRVGPKPTAATGEEGVFWHALAQLLLAGLIEVREDPDGMVRLYPVKGGYKQVLRAKPGERLVFKPRPGARHGGGAGES